jgi:signal transduction histidine kinase/PAS domain-containing protein
MRSESPLTSNGQEHTRLLKALRESELLRELAELLASSLDLTRILQVLVKRATEACDVSRCAVWLLNDTRTHFLPSAYHMSTQNMPGKRLNIANRMWHQGKIPFENSIMQNVLQHNGLLAINDLKTEKTMASMANRFFVRSILLVALIREDRLVGLMSFDNPGQMTEFTHDQQQLARAIGQQASVAIDNARLYQEAQQEKQRAERLIARAQSIYEVAMAVNSGEELSHVLEVAARHLAKGLYAQRVIIALLEKEQLQFANQSALGYSLTAPPAHLSVFEQCANTSKKQTPQFIYQDQFIDAEQSWFQYLGMENVLIIPLLVGGIQTSTETPGTKRQRNQEKRSVGFAFISYPHKARPPSAGYIAFAQDIAAHCALAIEKAHNLSETRRAEARAHEHANTLDAVFNAMTEGLIVLDAQGKMLLSNHNASRFIDITRKTKKQLATYLQQHPMYTLTGQPLAPEIFPLTRALSGERIRGERFLSKNPDGSERAIEVNIEPLLDNDQNHIGIVSAFRDITEQVRVEQRIRRALDFMLHAAEASAGITEIKEILYRVLAMTLTTLNSERGVVHIYHEERERFVPLLSIGFMPEEITRWLQKQAHWLIPDEQMDNYKYRNFMKHMRDGHATLISEDQISEETQSITHLLVLATPITHNKRLLGMLLIDRSTISKYDMSEIPEDQNATRPLTALEFNAWDMTILEGIAQFAGLAIEQTRWQQEAEIARTNEATMRESNALKDEFLAITAHEFRTPLTIILAHSQMMSRLLSKASDVDPKLQERLNESIFYIDEQTHQLTNIVNTFLEVTLINRGQIELVSEDLNLETLLKEIVIKHSTTSPNHQISYSVAKSAKPYLIYGDQARLQQIFVNLLQNAIKYSPQGGPITLSLQQRHTKTEPACIEVIVSDKGIGVPLEAQQHLFERFYRAPHIGYNQTRGVGLGLYVVAEFLHLHGGSICIKSSGIPGKGSSFVVTLPMLDKDHPAPG